MFKPMDNLRKENNCKFTPYNFALRALCCCMHTCKICIFFQGSSFQGDPLNISMHVTAPSTNKQEIIKRNLELLVLESQCKLENCHYHPGCRKFKWRIEHFNLCSGQKLENPDCKLCTVLLGYFHEHAKLCKNANCKVINCLQIKEKHRVP